MADGTGTRVFDDFRTSTIADLNAIKSELTDLASIKPDIANQQAQLHALTTNMATLIASVTALQGRLDQPLINPRPEPPRHHADHLPMRSIKLDFPRFNGSESPEDWLFKANEFFSYHSTPDEQRLTISSFHMDGVALSWFQWMRKNQQLSSWLAFSSALLTRFGRTTYSSPQGALTKLVQTSTVAAYQAEFEALANQTSGLPPSFFLDCFVEGLRPELRRKVKSFSPTIFSDAVGLARLQEEELADARRTPFRAFSPRPPPTQPLLPTPPSSAPPDPSSVRQLSPEDARTRRAKGLCFHCDDKWFRGHQCKSRKFFAFSTDDADLPQWHTNSLYDFDDDSPSPTGPEISYHALAGHHAPQTLRVTGFIHSQPVQILIDSGSTHNFIQARVAKFLKLPVNRADSFDVTVGNGEKLGCSGGCANTEIQLAGHTFHIDLFVLPLHGADIVLGVQWLKQLGPVTLDYSALTLQFLHDGTPVTISGIRSPVLQQLSAAQFNRLQSSHTAASYFRLDILQPDRPPTPLHPDIAAVLDRFPSVFSAPQGLPPLRPYAHRITLLPDAQPQRVRPYRYPYTQKKEIESLVRQMLADGIIRPSTSPFSSPALLIRKRDGTWRFCVDYRALNSLTIKDRFPIPTVDEMFDELQGACFFSKLDLRSGFHQIRVYEPDIPKTAFRTHDGHYEFLVMPFGLTNAPSTFQSSMNRLFQPFLRKFVIVFFDDILVYSRDWSSHLSHLSQILSTLHDHSFFVKLSKCSFGQATVQYLGHVISAAGVHMDSDKISAITSWPPPSTLRELRGFLGLAGYYRRFVRGYSSIAAPLTDLLKADAFLWSPRAQQAFVDLKQALISAPVLQLPDFSLPFTLDTDASNVGIGAVLSQQGHPLAYFSQKLSPRQQTLSTYAKEMLAIVAAVHKWRHYLLGSEFVVRTDHRSLQYLHDQALQTPEQSEWLRKLFGYKYKIVYKPGRDNLAADALSRQEVLFSFTGPLFQLTDDIRRAQQSDPSLQDLLHKLLASPSDFPRHSFHNDLLFYKNRLLIPATSPLRQTIFHELHTSPLGGHSGSQATLSRVQLSFFWPHMKTDIRSWVAACTVCQHCKLSTSKPPGLLQPLPIPTQVWEDLSLDFITSLPSSSGKTAILVVADRLTKYSHFFGLPPRYTSSTVADVFLKGVFRLHGVPRSLVSDRDPLFLSSFWTDLFSKLGTKLKFSSAYHPQSDGQTEVINRCLQQYLRCFVFDHPQHWFRYLPLAEYWYNTSYHSSLKMSPFAALYHRPPPPLLHHPRPAHPSAADSLLSDHSTVLRQLKSHLQSAQQRMVFQANKKRSDLSFAVGDFVLVRLRQYRQHSLVTSHHKFSKKFYGPYKVIEKIGSVAYKLLLPPGSRIHPTFHVSLLRPFVGDPLTAVPPPLPSELQVSPPPTAPLLGAPSTPPLPADSLPPFPPVASPCPGSVFPIRQEPNFLKRRGVDTSSDPAHEHEAQSSKPMRRKKRPTYLNDYYLILG